MMSEPFDPADANVWIARGRPPEHASILADVWRRFPDLPPDADRDARLARMRERAIALRPVMDAMSRAADEERQARNFAFTEARLADGKADDRERAILHAREAHGYDWDQAVRYAWGWYAAKAGWEPEVRRTGEQTSGALAYEQGFSDGGGNRDDLFDAARRALIAAPVAKQPAIPANGRPRPSDWPKPTDEARPARWHRRLLILGAPEAGLHREDAASECASAELMSALRTVPGRGELSIVVISGDGFHALDAAQPIARPLDASLLERLTIEQDSMLQLRALVAGREFDDILVAAQGPYLALLDAHARALPLCRTMERTRNTVLQQRAHFRIWLDRGLSAGETVGAGHIRWGKATKGLTGRLGEFTARYTGKLPAGGHRIVVETPDGCPALGFVSVQGEPLPYETIIGNRAHLRKAMAARLRAFGGATRLSPVVSADLLGVPAQ